MEDQPLLDVELLNREWIIQFVSQDKTAKSQKYKRIEDQNKNISWYKENGMEIKEHTGNFVNLEYQFAKWILGED